MGHSICSPRCVVCGGVGGALNLFYGVCGEWVDRALNLFSCAVYVYGGGWPTQSSVLPVLCV